MTACTDGAHAEAQPGPDRGPGSEQIEPGRGVFTFDGYPPLADRPVRVWYDAPADPSTAQILIVMHGLRRNGADYRDDWHGLVDGRNVLVLAPEFSDEDYPGAEAYNLGNIVDAMEIDYPTSSGASMWWKRSSITSCGRWEARRRTTRCSDIPPGLSS